MTTPLQADKALYLPLEVTSAVDFGPLQLTLGTQAEDAAGNLQYDSDGNPVQDPYDLTGYSVAADIKSSKGTVSFTVGTADLEDGVITLSLSDTQTTQLAGWKDTLKPTEKVGEYRVILTQGGTSKVKVYGPVSINTAGE